MALDIQGSYINIPIHEFITLTENPLVTNKADSTTIQE
jgi:hypothetical protein